MPTSFARRPSSAAAVVAIAVVVMATTATACRGSDAPISEREIIRDTAEAQAGDHLADSVSLAAADSALQAAIDAKDAAGVAGFYSDSAVLMPLAEPIVTGRAAVRAEWAKVFGIPGLSNRARLTSLVVSASGDLGVTRGWYRTTMNDAGGTPVEEVGKWVTVWRRGSDGAWRVISDIFNTDAAPPVHAASARR